MSNIINTVHAKYTELQNNYTKSIKEVKATIATKTSEADAKFAGKKIKMALAHAYISISSHIKPSHVGKMLSFRCLQVALISAAVSIAALFLTNLRGVDYLIKFAKDATALAILISIAKRVLSIDIKGMFHKNTNNDMF